MNVTIDDSGIEYAPVTALEMEPEDSPLLADAKALVEETSSLIEEPAASPPAAGLEVETPSADSADSEPCEAPPQPPAARLKRGRPRKPKPFADGPAEYAADHLLTESLIDAHLEFVKAKLTAGPIPAEAVRVYREIVGVLPSSLVDALLPITRLVEDRS